MKVKIYAAPAIEPVTIGELKTHLRLTSGDFADNVDSTQSIAPGSHGTTSGYGLIGASVDVLGYSAIVNLASGTNGATGTVDVKIQESDDNSTWNDWTGGAFAQITTANDNATYEKEYTGAKQYIRVVGKVLLAACEFGVDILRNAATNIEDDLLNDLITTARQQVEDNAGRALITQTWDMFLDKWPEGNAIKLPFGNLQTVSSVKWKDQSGSETTMVENTDYIVETNGEGCGRIVLPYGIVWPSSTLFPSNPISIRFECGYGNAADVPKKIKTAIKMVAAFMYEDRGEMAFASRSVENPLFDRLLASYRLWDEFE